MSSIDNNKDIKLAERFNSSVKNIKNELAKVIIGQDEIVNDLLVSLFAKGHSLLIGVPGLAKTLIIKTLADVVDLSFNRIQFTPDLMPSDITGTEIIEEDKATGKRSFRYVKGPIFSNIILADEINRTPPKTQSALLEAMQEQKVTAVGNVYELPNPFFVLATQNPIEQEGTYPLPEAQLDRFMFNLWLTYPSVAQEKEIIKSTTSEYTAKLNKVINKDEIILFQELIRKVPIADNVIEYAVNFVNATRKGSIEKLTNLINWGAGPRATQNLVLAAKTYAIMNGRFTPVIDDIKKFLIPVLRHRIIPSFNAEAEGINSVEIVRMIEKLV
ncbi:MAG TPA: MoxR family ATPase [Melioribacteraceae bacterium]|nr:MoxR family ATPase [Melioribacteraceae bacterium]